VSPAGPPRTRGGSAVLSVGAGIALSSAVGYLLLALVSRMLGPSDFALFMSFWGVMFGLASSLAMVEQEAARQSAEGDMSGAAPIRQVVMAAALIAGAAAALTLLPPVAARVYGDEQSMLGWFVLVATFGFSVQFMIRGLLIGSGRVRSYSLLIVAEAMVRLLALLLVWATVDASLGSVAGAIALGAFGWVFWAREAHRLTAASGTDDGTPTTRRPWRAPLLRAASLMAAAALTASIITGFPTMVTVVAGGSVGHAGGAIFAALQASRVPLLFVAPLQALAVPTIVRWRQRDVTSGPSVRTLIARGVLGTLVVAIVAAGAAWFVGPWGVRLAFGQDYVVTSEAVAGLVFSACFLALLQLMSAALVAFGSYRWVSVTWGTAAACTVLWLLASPLGVVGSTVVGALVGPAAGTAVALVVLWRLAHDAPAPGA